jgi:hypothetical protein
MRSSVLGCCKSSRAAIALESKSLVASGVRSGRRMKRVSLAPRHLPAKFAYECCVRGNPMCACLSCNFVYVQPSLQSASNDGRQKWRAILNLVQESSHGGTVLGPQPSMALLRASVWLIHRQRTSSSVTSSKISLPGSSPSGPRCGRDVKHEYSNGNGRDRARQ